MDLGTPIKQLKRRSNNLWRHATIGVVADTAASYQASSRMDFGLELQVSSHTPETWAFGSLETLNCSEVWMYGVRVWEKVCCDGLPVWGVSILGQSHSCCWMSSQ